MAPYLHIPQTPSAKTQFEEQLDELVPGSDRSASQSTLTRPPSPSDRAADAEEIDRYRRKTMSPNPPQLTTPYDGNGNHLGPPDAFHRLSIGSFPDAGYGPSMSPLPFRGFSPSWGRASPSPGPSGLPGASPGSHANNIPVPRFWARFWSRNKPVLLVFGAQFFGALMNMFARLLELEGPQAFHPIQLLFVRMVATTTASCLYMYYYRVPHFPLGPPGVRWLLVLRGLTGFFGIFGMWYSMVYLPLAEATVITFLTPSVSGYICHVLLKDPFTRKEQIASVVALVGITLITRPLSLFSSDAAPVTDVDEGAVGAVGAVINATVLAIREAANAANATLDSTAIAIAAVDSVDGVTASQRLIAIGVALLGVIGGSCAFTTIRAIGTRAHALISVNYFSTWCLIVSGTVLTFAPMLDIGQPQLQFALPHSLRQWLLLLLICVCGFATQFLATMGLGLERSNRATAMVYTQMLFAAGFDRFVFGHQMGPVSLAGCGLIIGSAVWVALSKKPTPDKEMTATTAAAAAMTTEAPLGSSSADIEIGIIDTRGRRGEAMPMLGAEDEDSDDDEENKGSRVE